MSEYLTEEEQYKECLSAEQISRIKDPILRDIRYEYLKKQRALFIDEYNFPDQIFIIESDRLVAEEAREIARYKATRKKNG